MNLTTKWYFKCEEPLLENCGNLHPKSFTKLVHCNWWKHVFSRFPLQVLNPFIFTARVRSTTGGVCLFRGGGTPSLFNNTSTSTGPRPLLRDTPIQSQMGGYPIQDWMGYLPIWEWMGYPSCLGLDWGTLHLGLDGVPPSPLGTGLGYPPPPRPGLDGTSTGYAAGALLLRFPAGGLSCFSHVLKRYHINWTAMSF